MWTFRRAARGEKLRNPIQGEFFSTDAIADPAQALVRESIQNSLDAWSGSESVHMRFFLASGDAARTPASVAPYFRDAWKHFSAPGNGLRNAPDDKTDCAYLTVEDFGTKGLTGDERQAEPVTDYPNPFFLFFRAEGLSQKSGTELGRWGVGKFVFPRSSLASTHFGVTVRYDDHRRMMLGAVTLKAHRVDGAQYTPDGLFGQPEPDGFVNPIENARAIDQFSRTFGVTRTVEPGLSVIVPFLDPEITFERLLAASVIDYFVPLIRGALTIELATPKTAITLSASTFDEVLAAHESTIGKERARFASLARWAVSVHDTQYITIGKGDPDRAPRWNPELLSVEAGNTLQLAQAARERIAVRVPVTIREKGKCARESHFDIFLEQDKECDGRPVFVREGIVVSDARGKRAKGVRSLVLIEDKPLAALLGDSENPAHTQWQKDSSNFRGKYTYGSGVISFVSESVGQLMAILARSDNRPDSSLTLDFFSIPPEDDAEADLGDSVKPRNERGNDVVRPRVDVAGHPGKIVVGRTESGFRVGPGAAPPAHPYLVEIKCAYETRTGNPIRKWNPQDFVVGGGDIKIAHEGSVTVTGVKGNWVLLTVTGENFTFSANGFDPARDLYVRAQVRERNDAGSQD